MPACQTVNLSFLEAVHKYFAELNPIANKISEDINETRLAYGNLWHRLKPDEHADIINETIIKPEISLHYFDKFSSSSSISRASLASSKDDECTDSSVASVNINDCSSHADFFQNKNNTARINSVKVKEIEPATISHYGFDRNRLRTYASQKVALKIIRDEILGIYRDEHSKPFSYKTKSQINLHLFTDSSLPNDDDDDDHICLLSSTAAFVDDGLLKSEDLLKTDLLPSVANYKKNVSSYINKTKAKETIANSLCSIPYEKVKNCSWNITNNKRLADNNSNMMQSSVFDNSNVVIKEQRLKSYMDTSVVTLSTAQTYAVYSDDYFDRKESKKLMHNRIGSGVLTTSSSTATSEDEEDDNEKPLCEDVKLLDNDISLRRGFDFLNNW